jgi:glyoxylase-like metal-dependent hydrolase (beta-lactamase superfamily II)
MNIYFLEDGDGVVQFDAGTKAMTKKARAAAEELGGVKRIVLGHATPTTAAPRPRWASGPLPSRRSRRRRKRRRDRPYMDLSQLPVAPVRWIYPFLLRRWDGGAVKIDGTVSEGDEVAGFRVLHFPGHAPG